VSRASRLKPAEIADLFRRLADRIPEPKTELDYVNDYTLLVAVVLSAQSTDAGVNIATRDLFKTVTTPEAMVAIGEEKLSEAIKTIGLFNTKAKNVIALSRVLVDEHDGKVPADRDTLMKLPGVGRKTANVVLNTAFGEEAFAVDTHIFRVCNRTGLAPGKHVLQVELKLEKVVPQPFRLNAHHWLILHGRYICKARLPECWRCPVIDLCRYKPKTLPPDERAKAKSSAARSASRGRSAVRTAKGPKPRTLSAGRSRARPSRLP
jgi:endonuclease-3